MRIILRLQFKSIPRTPLQAGYPRASLDPPPSARQDRCITCSGPRQAVREASKEAGRQRLDRRSSSGVVKAAARDTTRGKRLHYGVVWKLAARKSAGKHYNRGDKKAETSSWRRAGEFGSGETDKVIRRGENRTSRRQTANSGRQVVDITPSPPLPPPHSDTTHQNYNILRCFRNFPLEISRHANRSTTLVGYPSRGSGVTVRPSPSRLDTPALSLIRENQP
ncbi:hypothetical protein E2C01_059741 [Portunus trituberculatus]|uniref:Uncharacterized protein n=1 Tax=Portunus trituberculatus TaxID=210409 RepID=A0A5B7H669_PORTR|nr:hypothetical protein [Portunus trituberculatus]